MEPLTFLQCILYECSFFHSWEAWQQSPWWHLFCCAVEADSTPGLFSIARALSSVNCRSISSVGEKDQRRAQH